MGISTHLKQAAHDILIYLAAAVRWSNGCDYLSCQAVDFDFL